MRAVTPEKSGIFLAFLIQPAYPFMSKGMMNVTQYLLMLPDRRNSASREQLLRRIRAEFAEMPCLRLTCGQAQRLFGLRRDVCERVMSTLIGEATLFRGPDERYGVRANVGWRPPEAGAANPQGSAYKAS